MTAIDIRGLTKTFDGKEAVKGLTLQIEQGELFSLLGVNGAGKTTTIRMLSCLIRPTAGDALVFGDSIVHSPQAVKQKIGISPQETAIAHQLTVRENLELTAEIYGSSRQQAREKAQQSMEMFGLTEEQKCKAKHLSGGMQRRLSLAMALITDPSVLFLDEPTLGLDVLARRELWKIVEKLKKTATVILTTHYMEEAEALSDRVGVMAGGRLLAVGTPTELIERTQAPSFEEAVVRTVTENA